jgi:hypothetical protein
MCGVAALQISTVAGQQDAAATLRPDARVLLKQLVVAADW